MSVAWGLPSALWALGLVVVPVIVHLLSRRAARIVALPSLRLLSRRATPSVRVWRPRDPLLLVARMGAVAAAALAVAAPLVITPGRLARWNAREVRAVVLEPGLERASRGADASLARAREGALSTEVFVEETLAGGLGAAAAWLHDSPPARRRVVLVTSGRQGRVAPEDLAALPSNLGVAVALAERAPSDDRRMVRREAGRWHPADHPPVRVVVAEDATAVATTAPRADGAPLTFVVASASQRERAERIVDIAFRAPLVTAFRTLPVVVRLGPGQAAPREAAPAAGATASTAWWRWLRRLVKDPELQQITSAAHAESGGAGTMVLHDDAGTPCVSASAAPASGLMVLDRCDDVLAATLLRAAARTSDAADPRPAGRRWEETTLRSWEREPGPVSRATITATSAMNDGRWCWAACLGLLLLEQWLRRRHDSQTGRDTTTQPAREAAA